MNKSKLILFIALAALAVILTVSRSVDSIIWPTSEAPKNVIAERAFSMEKRYADTFVNGVFRDNILLALEYLDGKKIDSKNVDWNAVTSAQTFKLTLEPGETFAFHDDVLPEYQGKVTKTSNTHFNAAEGYKFSGKLWGDGVCHLASFIYMAALDAGLPTYAPTRHDFAKIPEVPREFGVSIYSTPGVQASDQVQNLYITNDREVDITFEFTYDGRDLNVAVVATPNTLASR